MTEGGDPNAIGGNRSPGVNAASQQTIFIVSGSIKPNLRGGNPNAMLG